MKACGTSTNSLFWLASLQHWFLCDSVVVHKVDAHTYDHADPANYVETAAGILLANAVGSTLGPLLASILMAWTSTAMLFLYTAIVQAALAIFALVRVANRAPLTTADKTDFDLAATAAVGGVMSPEPLDPDDPNVVTPPPVEPEPEEDTSNSAPQRAGVRNGPNRVNFCRNCSRSLPAALPTTDPRTAT